MTVANGKVTGTLKYFNKPGSAITEHWGPGYFFAFKVSNIDAHSTKALVGLQPSEGTGLVDIINDPDKNGIAMITDKNTQVFKVIQSDNAGHRNVQIYDLKGLTLQAEE